MEVKKDEDEKSALKDLCAEGLVDFCEEAAIEEKKTHVKLPVD